MIPDMRGVSASDSSERAPLTADPGASSLPNCDRVLRVFAYRFEERNTKPRRTRINFVDLVVQTFYAPPPSLLSLSPTNSLVTLVVVT